MQKHLFFDCDGVLVDTEKIAAQVFVSKMKDYDVHISYEHYLATHTGKTFSGALRKEVPTISDEECKQVVHYLEHTTYDRLVAIKGMKNLLLALKRPFSVVSNSFLWQVEKAISLLEIKDSVQDYFSAEQVEQPKPAPDLYNFAMQHAGVEPHQSIAIEDSLSGIKSALEAGLEVIAFMGGSHITSRHIQLVSDLNVSKVVYDAKELSQVLRNS